MIFDFGEYALDVERRELRRSGALVPLEPQTFDVLGYLIENRDRVIAKEELMDQIWGGRFVSETAVTSRIKQARRAVGDDGQAQSVIRTHHGRGYRFVAESARVTRGVRASGSSASSGPVLEVIGPGVVSNYRLSGQGPPDLVFLSGSSNDEIAVDRLDFLADLAGLGRLIAVAATSSSAGPEDLIALLDDAASERCVLITEGAADRLALATARGHPERVAGLVLFAVSPPDDADPMALSSITAPALVLQRGSVGAGRAARSVAARLPQAEIVWLDGMSSEIGVPRSQVSEAIVQLVEDAALQQAADRTLSALIGLSGPDADPVAEVLVQLGGVRRRGPHDALLVSFDGPASAMRALGTRRIRGLLAGVGACVAIDEVSTRSPFVSGHGVDVARQVAQRAKPGEVLMPNVIKDLLAGSGLTVEAAGEFELDYVGPHQVFRWVR